MTWDVETATARAEDVAADAVRHGLPDATVKVVVKPGFAREVRAIVLAGGRRVWTTVP